MATLLLGVLLAAPAAAQDMTGAPADAQAADEQAAYDTGTLTRTSLALPSLGDLSFRPKRRPDGTCCPPPPQRELREDPCTPLDPCEPIDCCESPFSLTLGLGVSFSEGNSEKFDIAFSGALTYDRRPWLARLGWLWAYGESDGRAATDTFHADLRLERRIGTRWSAFGLVSFDDDKLAGLQYRWIGTLGVGYRFFEYKGTYLKAEVGGGLTVEKRRLRPETSDPSAYLGGEYFRAFRNGIDLLARARFLPNLDDYDLSLLVVETVLAVPLTLNSALAVTVRVDHVIDAPDPAEDTDVIFVVGLQVNL